MIKNNIPYISVKEISRLIINTRKRMLKDKWTQDKEFEWIDLTCREIRKSLELRRRSRLGVTL